MPLKKGYSRDTISANVAAMEREGRPRAQAIAIALHEARKSYFKRFPQGALPSWLAPKDGKRLGPKYKGNPAPRFHDTEEATREIEKAALLYKDFSGHEGEELGCVEKPVIPDVAVVVGELDGIAYEAVRDGQREKYFHKFSKSSRPLLCVSPDGLQLFIVGGEYNFTDHGIVDTA